MVKQIKQIEREYLKRLSFDNCLKHNEWIIRQIELRV